MIRRPPRSTRTDTPFPYTTLFRAERGIETGKDLPFTNPVADIHSHVDQLIAADLRADARFLPWRNRAGCLDGHGPRRTATGRFGDGQGGHRLGGCRRAEGLAHDGDDRKPRGDPPRCATGATHE